MTTDKKKCPLCQNDETITHLYQCQHRENWRQQMMDNLHKFLNKQKTPADIATSMKSYITTRFQNPIIYQHVNTFLIFAGLLPISWRQHMTYQSNHSVANRWATQISNWMVNQGHSLWMVRNKSIDEDSTKYTQASQ